MVELDSIDFDIMRERFDNLLSIPEAERTDKDLFQLMRLTANMPLFEHCKMTDIHKEIMKGIVVKKFNKGDVLFKQGDEGDGYYFVLRGCIDLYYYDINEQTGKIELKFVTAFLPGVGFGELALMYECPRTGTAVANSYTELIVVKKKLYDDYVKEYHEKSLYELVTFYYTIPIFTKETMDNMLKYSLRSKKVQFKTNEVVLKCNSYITDYIFVHSGTIKAYATIKVNDYIMKNAHKMTEEAFVEYLKKLQGNSAKRSSNRLLTYSDLNKSLKLSSISSRSGINYQEGLYDEVIDVMEFNNKDIMGEWYAAKNRRIDVYLIPSIPSELVFINTQHLKQLNPNLDKAINKFAAPIFEYDRAFKKLYKNMTWKHEKNALLSHIKKKK
jgi:CRP-like cAMP-binding protein